MHLRRYLPQKAGSTHGHYKQKELCLKFPLLETTCLNEDNNSRKFKVNFLKPLFTLQAYFNCICFEHVHTLSDTPYKVLMHQQYQSILNVFKYKYSNNKAILLVHFGVIINVYLKVLFPIKDENEVTFNIRFYIVSINHNLGGRLDL